MSEVGRPAYPNRLLREAGLPHDDGEADQHQEDERDRRTGHQHVEVDGPAPAFAGQSQDVDLGDLLRAVFDKPAFAALAEKAKAQLTA